MKKLIVLIGLLTFSAFGSETYDCVGAQRVNGDWQGTKVEMKTSFWSGKVTKVTVLSSEVKINELKEAKNPFIASFADYYEVYKEVKELASKLNFKSYYKSGLMETTEITMDDSMWNLEKKGYLYYYHKMCILGSCSHTNYFYQCVRI